MPYVSQDESARGIDEASDFQALVSWVRSEGGSVDSRLMLGTTSNGIRGLLAAEAIEAGAVLLHVPKSLILDGGDNRPRVVRDELLKKEHGRWWPYLRLDESLTAGIPATWSDADLAELQGLEPRDSRRHIHWYSQAWAGGMPYEGLSDADKQALWMVVTRSCDAGLVPIYDLANHNNGQLNTRVDIADDGSLGMSARWDLPQGQEVFNSYGHSSSSDIFRDYGFIEPWPRVWKYALPSGQQQEFALLSAEGPVVLVGEQGAPDLAPGRSTLAEKTEQALVALAAMPGVQLLSIAQGMEIALGQLPTRIEQDKRLVVTATGERRRAILYRMAYKQSLIAAMQFLQRYAGDGN
jgi:hypothetical protein